MTKNRIRLRVMRVTCFRRDERVNLTHKFPSKTRSGTENVRSKSCHNGSSICFQTALPTGRSSSHRSPSITAAIEPNSADFCAPTSVVDDTSEPDASDPTRPGDRGTKQRRHAHPRRGALAARSARGPRSGERARRRLRARAARARVARALGRVGRRRFGRETYSTRWRRAPLPWCVRALRMLAHPELLWALPSLFKASRGAA